MVNPSLVYSCDTSTARAPSQAPGRDAVAMARVASAFAGPVLHWAGRAGRAVPQFTGALDPQGGRQGPAALAA